jgi:hypothetical protein
MEIGDLDCLFFIDINRTSKLQGGLFASVQTNTYASYNLSVANANAIAVGQLTQTSTNTWANLYQGNGSSHSSAYAQGTAYASSGQDTYLVKATEIKSYWW